MIDNEIPTNIAGLDTVDGLRRLLGKKPLYLSILRKFAVGQKCAVATIHAALDSGDTNNAERIAHTTKGAAASIGAVEVQARAAEVEVAIREGQPRKKISELLGALAVPLAAMILALEDALPAPDDRGHPEHITEDTASRLT